MVKLETPSTKRKEIATQRMNICEKCDKFQSFLSMCNECGCFMKAKTSWPSSSCPLGKWQAYKEEK